MQRSTAAGRRGEQALHLRQLDGPFDRPSA